MATPDEPDPNAPTERVEPAAPGRSGHDAGPTRRATRILRPDTGRNTRVSASPQSRRPHRPRPWQRFLSWLAGLVSRLVIRPAAELEYAVPAELRRRYAIHDRIGAGGEAVVYRAEPRGEPQRPLALKVYRPGHDINRELLDRLRARSSAAPHAPAIHDYGYARSSWDEETAWEAQEYFSGGSLRGLLEDAPLPEERAREIVSAIAECLHYWQDSLNHNHTDVKPENLLVRSSDPPVFALTDFGGAVRATMSRVYGGLAVTQDYAAPEVVEGRREAPAAWWSLGVMVHELVTGRRPERGENWLVARSTGVDVSAVADEEWRLLARGLLTPDASGRWGYAEVRQWLSGERPQLASSRTTSPIRFADVSHHDPPSLAFDLLDRSDKGEVWLGTHWPTVRTWLDREVNDYTFDRGYLTDLEQRPERVHVAISALAARFVPGMPPRYRGHETSAEGVLRLVSGEQRQHAVLREAVEFGALELAARHWCDHSECRTEGTGRCALLERVHHEVPLVMERVEERVRLLASEHGAGTPARHEWDTCWARVAELVLDPRAWTRQRRLLRAQSWHPAQRSNAPRLAWWRGLRTAGLHGGSGSTPVDTTAALATALLLLPAASRAGDTQREHDRANSRARWHNRWQRAASGCVSGWYWLRERLTRRSQPGSTAVGDPTVGEPPATGHDYPSRGGKAERKRLDRGMRQLQKAMGAGRCRRFVYPVALLGLVDGLGRVLRGDGYFPGDNPAGAAYVSLVDFSGDGAVRPVTGTASSVAETLGDSGQWWYPVLLGLVLFLLGRTTASDRRRARTQLMARRLAVVGTVLLAVVLLGSVRALGGGVLIPLDSLLG
ncbi:serine/threonine protein kinase [Haloactinospora alba]|uniref:mitogen-activated protein kinase kinase n=1 Tax=Haloactinospora alba TaxID=405555 RepID=A0A543NJG0_9ACTN|nr:protein kinase [Haloactinospora alba]TQN32005.1 serine/threonine protein kinase [Haloactinospora alba]